MYNATKLFNYGTVVNVANFTILIIRLENEATRTQNLILNN